MHNIQGEYYMQTMHIYAQYSGEYNMHNIQVSTICTIFKVVQYAQYSGGVRWERNILFHPAGNENWGEYTLKI